jgi:hypothetical protein
VLPLLDGWIAVLKWKKEKNIFAKSRESRKKYVQ